MRSKQVTKENTLLVVLIMLVVVLGFVLPSYSAVLTSSDRTANLFVLNYRAGGPSSSELNETQQAMYDQTAYQYMVGSKIVHKITTQEDDANFSNSFYCLNAVKQFPGEQDGVKNYTNYGSFYNTDSEEIQDIFLGANYGTPTWNANHGAISWLIKNIYLKKLDTTYKDQYLAKAFADSTDYTLEEVEGFLTDDDIDVVQQYAIWHFTNGNEEPYSRTTLPQMAVKSLLDEESHPINTDRQRLARHLYQYLITAAVEHANDEAVLTYPVFVEDGKVSAAYQDENYYLAGPFNIQSASGLYSDYKVEILNEKNEVLDPSTYEVLVVDASSVGGNYIPSTKPLTELFDTPFYIRVPAGTNIKNIKAFLSYKVNDKIATVWKTTSRDDRDTHQEALLITQENLEGTSGQVYTISPKDYYYLELTKEGSNMETLPNAVYTIKINNEDPVDFTTEANGKIAITVATTEYEGEDRIEITEKTPPVGYAKNDGTVVLTVTKTLNANNKLAISAVNVTRPSDNNSYPIMMGLNTTTKLISLNITDTKIEGSYKVQLLKRDKNDTTKVLGGAKFQIGDEVRETTTSGLIEVDRTITSAEDETLHITEVEAPNNYKKIEGTLDVVVAKEIAGNEYKVTGITVSTPVSGMEATYNATTNTIEIIAEDEALQGNYNFVINKVDSYESAPLSGVPFTVKVNDKAAETVTTGTDGLVAIDPIEITGEGTDTIVVKEVTAPEGYKLFDEETTITVTKSQGDSAYVVTKVEVSPTNDKVVVSYNSDTNTVTYTLKNDITDDSYHINLRKLDKTTSSPLENAKFMINGQEYSTGASGTIEVPATVINATGTDKIRIEEIKAPNGYKKLYGVLELDLVKQVVDKKYSITLNTTNAVEGYTATLDQSTKTINVVATNEKNEGEYDLTLIKVDKNNNAIRLPNAEFEINGSTFTTNSYGRIILDPIKITESGTDVITIKEKTPPEGYILNDETLTLKVNKVVDGSDFHVEIAEQSGSTNMVATVDGSSNTIEVVASDEAITGEYGFELVKTDLTTGEALTGVPFTIKYGNHEAESVVTGTEGKIVKEGISIASVNKETITISEENAPEGYEKLSGPIVIEVEKEIRNNHYVVTNVTKVSGDSATVSLGGTTIKVAVTNEKSVKGNYDLDIVKTDELGAVVTNLQTVFTINNEEKKTENGVVKYANVEINKNNVSQNDIYVIKETKAPDNYSEFEGTIKVTVTKKLAADEKSYVVDSVKMEVTDKNGNTVEDTENISFTNEGGRQAIVVKVKNYEKLDLSLRKYISKVSNEEDTIDYTNGTTKRVPEVDLAPLDSGNKTTASYNHPKNVVEVKKGDLVEYKIRVYNEGDKDGYVTKVIDYIPEGLSFVTDSETNKIWDYDTVTRKAVTNDQFVPTLLTGHKVAGEELKYQELTIVCKVLDTAKTDINLVNMAEIAEMQYADKTIAKDRDSEVENFEMPQDRPSYYGGTDENPSDNYIPGQQDDDDFDRIIIKDNTKADLSLRKFVTAVSKDLKFEEGEYLSGDLSRVPVVDKSKLDSNASLTATYNHTKVAYELDRKDYVLYTIRVYNEGGIKAKAAAVADYLPDYLEFVSSEETDINSIWTYDEETNSVSTNDKYVPKLLNENVVGRDLDYQDLQIVCRVKTTAIDNTNITNLSEITKYEDENGNNVPDRDSGAGNMVKPSDYSGYNGGIDQDTNDNYIPGQEDEDDFDRVVVKPIFGHYSVEIVKKDEAGNVLANKVTEFEINEEAKSTFDGVIKYKEDVEINKDNVSTNDTYLIKETKTPENFVGLDGTVKVTVTKKMSEDATKYEVASAKMEIIDKDGNSKEDTNNIKIESSDGKTKIVVTIVNYEKLDFSLRKFISGVSIDNETFTDEELLTGDKSREPKVDLTLLDTNEETTAKYNGPKDPVYVERDSYVLFTIRVYNEGSKSGYVKQVKDYIPKGFEFVKDAKVNEIWDYNETNRTITTNDKYVAKLLSAHMVKEELDYQDLKVVLKVSADIEDNTILTNIAEITKIARRDGEEAIDRDSEEDNFVYPEKPSEYKGGEDKDTNDNYVPGQEDDDDFDKVIVNTRKGSYSLQIVKVNSEGKVIETGTAKFKVNDKEYKTTKGYINVDKVEINKDNASKEDVYSIKELEAPSGYNKSNDTIKVIVPKQITKDNKSYEIGKVSMTYTHEDGYSKDLSDRVEIIKNNDGVQIIRIKVSNEQIKPAPQPNPEPAPQPQPSQTTVIPAPKEESRVVYSNSAPRNNTIIVARNTTNTNTNSISVKKTTPTTGDILPVVVLSVIIAVVAVNVIQIVITKKSNDDKE